MKLTGKKRYAFVLSDTAAGRLSWVDADGKLVRTMDGISACFDLCQNTRGEVLESAVLQITDIPFQSFGNEKDKRHCSCLVQCLFRKLLH